MCYLSIRDSVYIFFIVYDHVYSQCVYCSYYISDPIRHKTLPVVSDRHTLQGVNNHLIGENMRWARGGAREFIDIKLALSLNFDIVTCQLVGCLLWIILCPRFSQGNFSISIVTWIELTHGGWVFFNHCRYRKCYIEYKCRSWTFWRGGGCCSREKGLNWYGKKGERGWCNEKVDLTS